MFIRNFFVIYILFTNCAFTDHLQQCGMPAPVEKAQVTISKIQVEDPVFPTYSGNVAQKKQLKKMK